MAVDPRLAELMRSDAQSEECVGVQHLRALHEIRKAMTCRGATTRERLRDVAAVLLLLDEMRGEQMRDGLDGTAGLIEGDRP